MYHGVKLLCGFIYTISLLGMLGMTVPHMQTTVMETQDTVQNEQTVSQEHLEPPKIALTFDDGPSEKCTGRLLDGLKERGVKATFFLIGENAEKNPELVKRIDEEGHLIGNHTYHHVEITKISDTEAINEIQQTDEVVYSIIGKHV